MIPKRNTNNGIDLPYGFTFQWDDIDIYDTVRKKYPI
jgi:hypothetical protein